MKILLSILIVISLLFGLGLGFVPFAMSDLLKEVDYDKLEEIQKMAAMLPEDSSERKAIEQIPSQGRVLLTNLIILMSLITGVAAVALSFMKKEAAQKVALVLIGVIILGFLITPSIDGGYTKPNPKEIMLLSGVSLLLTGIFVVVKQKMLNKQ